MRPAESRGVSASPQIEPPRAWWVSAACWFYRARVRRRVAVWRCAVALACVFLLAGCSAAAGPMRERAGAPCGLNRRAF